MEKHLTEEQHWDLFQRLFPNGLHDPSLVQKLAPKGWERSPLVLVYHPTAEQVYEETLRLRDNLRRLRRRTSPPEEEPQIMLDALRREMPVDAPKPTKECADLLGCCLWDVFADNHDVCTDKGALVDLGSFRAAAGFIADFRHRRSHSEARLTERRDYIEFYLGTWMVRHRADLTPVYELIFRRMQQLGLDWRYVHPRLMLVDLRPLHEALESENVPEAVRYDPTENYWRERREAARDAEVADLQRNLDEAYKESVEEARHDLPPATVRAYQQVYGRFPAGWPPEGEGENSS
ncbi:MAG: hypothetical protein HZB34_10700 [Nitrospirae bacterium]|nr:hypothetical protein [Nitrospirota bacterium]